MATSDPEVEKQPDRRAGARMGRAVFAGFREIIYRHSGIALGQRKVALLCARVGKRMRALGLTDYGAYLELVGRDDTGAELVHLLDAVSTNVTSFFREADHFDLLRRSVEGWASAGQRRFRIWSAGCSSGEEPYSIAMSLRDTAMAGGLDLKILATDLSTQALARGRAGQYPRKKADGVPEPYLGRFFEKVHVPDGEEEYRLTADVRGMVVFRRLNLAGPPYPMKGPLDAVFCRNVMIYFDTDVRRRLLSDLHRLIKPGGLLFVGHAESLTGMLSPFRIVQASVYTRP